MAFDPGNRLIAAIDTPGRAEADQLIEQLGGVPGWIKLGLELFCAEGPAVVAEQAARGRRVMLDLKLHDIPETVARATARVAALGAELLTVHAAGSRAMLEAAVRAAGALRVLAVTVLTSLDEIDLGLIGAQGPVRELVVRRARLAIDAVRAIAPPGFLIVTPGVRPTGAETGDQKRVMTPREARAAGADLIVVGRPLRQARDPAAAARAIVAELAAPA
jgi:orotidine-5'-phosphate decarboxylase